MIDLHIHTTYSDGTKSVKEILEQAEALKLDYISITDHDKCSAYEELRDINISEYYSGKIIRGVEIKCAYKDSTIELLAYDYDYDKMSKWLKNFYADKDRKVVETRYFNKLYAVCEELNLTMAKKEDIKWNPENDWAGKTIYDEIKKHPENESKLPEDLWNDGVQTFSKRYYGKKGTIWYLDKSKDLPSVGEALKAIKDSGGVAFIAHIFIYKWMEDIKKELRELVSNYDIDGIECYHSDFTEEDIKYINEFCDTNNFLKSGGSDYHGANKPHIQLAIGRGKLRIPTKIVEQWYKE